MKKKWFIVGLCVFLVGCATIGPLMGIVEQPQYDVRKEQGDIEIRRYAPMIIAQVTIIGPRKDAVGDGFRMLADYIFGNNTVRQDIAMTAPVQQQENHHISMTAPVQQQGRGQSWEVSFIMPSEYTMNNLPMPNNEHVIVKEIPSQEFAVIQFSGINDDENIREHEQRLKDYVEEHNIQVTGVPKYAFYDPPWTLPFMRRNEVMLELVAP